MFMIHINLDTRVYVDMIYRYVYIYVCVCIHTHMYVMCVCVRASLFSGDVTWMSSGTLS